MNTSSWTLGHRVCQNMVWKDIGLWDAKVRQEEPQQTEVNGELWGHRGGRAGRRSWLSAGKRSVAGADVTTRGRCSVKWWASGGFWQSEETARRKWSPRLAPAETAASTQPHTDASKEGGSDLNGTMDRGSTRVTVGAGYTSVAWNQEGKYNIWRKMAVSEMHQKFHRPWRDNSHRQRRQPGYGVTQILYLKSESTIDTYSLENCDCKHSKALFKIIISLTLCKWLGIV